MKKKTTSLGGASAPVTVAYNASLLKILMANLYDLVALTGMMFVAALPWAVLSSDGHVPAGSLPFQLYLLALINIYFCLSWCRGGQTLGMRPWRMYIRQDRPTASVEAAPGPMGIGFAQAQTRFWTALVSWAAGTLGVLWALTAKGSWHDRASHTRLVIQRAK